MCSMRVIVMLMYNSRGCCETVMVASRGSRGRLTGPSFATGGGKSRIALSPCLNDPAAPVVAVDGSGHVDLVAQRVEDFFVDGAGHHEVDIVDAAQLVAAHGALLGLI